MYFMLVLKILFHISSGGLSDAQLKPTITAPATIYRAGGDWAVKVPPGLKTVKISISAIVNGKVKNLGGLDFRVKRVPSPIAKIGNTDGGPIGKNILLAAGGIIPNMPEDFEFDLNFDIVSYSFSVVRGGDIFSRDGRGNALYRRNEIYYSQCETMVKEFGLTIFRQRGLMASESLIQLISLSSNFSLNILLKLL